MVKHAQGTKAETPRHNSAQGRPAPPYSAGGIRLEFLRRAQRELVLNPEQRERIERILKESQERTREIMEPVSEDLREEVEKTKQEFLAVLSPEQRRRFDELVKKQHRPHDQRRPTLTPSGASNPVSPVAMPER